MAKSTSRPAPKLDKLDKNFRVKTSAKKLTWLDGFSTKLALRGLAWEKENRQAKNFRRLPDRAEKGLSEGVRVLSQCPASVFLSFFTDSPDISVRMELAGTEQMDHMTSVGMSGAELYFRNGPVWHPIAVARAPLTEAKFERALLENAPRQRREYRLYLPLYKKLDSIALGFQPGAMVEPAPAPKGTKPIFFYGTSITQGGCANTAGSDFVSMTGRLLDAEVVNFGFSGNGKGEPEIARLIREVDVEMFILDFLANAAMDTLDSVLPEFIRLLRQKHKRTPIVIVSSPAFDQSLWGAKNRGFDSRKRDIAMRTYLRLKDAGDAHIHFIDGRGLLHAGETGNYVDGVHPTSQGFVRIAENLAPQLRVIRLAEFA